MTYTAGQHYKICDVCGFKHLSGQMKKRWDGLLVCDDDFEVDHPQKYIRVQADGQAVPDPRPRPADVYTDYKCYVFANQAYADMGEADCMQADKQLLSYSYCVTLKGST